MRLDVIERTHEKEKEEEEENEEEEMGFDSCPDKKSDEIKEGYNKGCVIGGSNNDGSGNRNDCSTVISTDITGSSKDTADNDIISDNECSMPDYYNKIEELMTTHDNTANEADSCLDLLPSPIPFDDDVCNVLIELENETWHEDNDDTATAAVWTREGNIGKEIQGQKTIEEKDCDTGERSEKIVKTLSYPEALSSLAEPSPVLFSLPAPPLAPSELLEVENVNDNVVTAAPAVPAKEYANKLVVANDINERAETLTEDCEERIARVVITDCERKKVAKVKQEKLNLNKSNISDKKKGYPAKRTERGTEDNNTTREKKLAKVQTTSNAASIAAIADITMTRSLVTEDSPISTLTDENITAAAVHANEDDHEEELNFLHQADLDTEQASTNINNTAKGLNEEKKATKGNAKSTTNVTRGQAQKRKNSTTIQTTVSMHAFVRMLKYIYDRTVLENDNLRLPDDVLNIVQNVTQFNYSDTPSFISTPDKKRAKLQTNSRKDEYEIMQTNHDSGTGTTIVTNVVYPKQYKKKEIKLIYLNLIGLLFTTLDSCNCILAFQREAFKYFLATYSKYIDIMHFKDTNQIDRNSKNSNKKHKASILSSGAILLEYFKTAENCISNLSRCDINDVNALRFIIENGIIIPKLIYEPLHKINTTSHYETDVIKVDRSNYNKVPITTTLKSIKVYVTKHVALGCEGKNAYFLLPPALEREITATAMMNMPFELIVLDVMLGTKNKIIDIYVPRDEEPIIECMEKTPSSHILCELLDTNETNKMTANDVMTTTTTPSTASVAVLPSLYQERLKVAQKLFPGIKTVSIQNDKYTGSYIYIAKEGFNRTMYIYYKPCQILAMVGACNKHVWLAFRNDAGELEFKLKMPYTSLINPFVTTKMVQTTKMQQKDGGNNILFNGQSIKVNNLVPTKEFQYFVEVSLIEVRESNKLGALVESVGRSLEAVTHIQEFKQNSGVKESSATMNEIVNIANDKDNCVMLIRAMKQSLNFDIIKKFLLEEEGNDHFVWD